MAPKKIEEARIPKRMKSLPTVPAKGKTFVATVPNYWARGETLGNVLSNLRLYVGEIRFSDCSMVIMEVPENFQVHLITGAITWRGEDADGRILFDSRTKAQRNFDDSGIACLEETEEETEEVEGDRSIFADLLPDAKTRKANKKRGRGLS